MRSVFNINFEISERKLFLRIFDVFFVLGGLHLIGSFFKFDYFTLTQENWYWSVILAIYIIIFGTIFELYDLRASSQLDKTFKNVVLTSSVTVLVYLLTPFFSPSLPDRRGEIIYFYISILISVFIWRVIYIALFNSPRFYKKVLLIGEVEHIQSMIDTFTEIDPNYDIIGFINSDRSSKEKLTEIEEFEADNLEQVVDAYKISEIVVASYNAEAITPELYNSLITLLEQGYAIREYTQVYESLVHRVPVQFVGKDFYKYFPFSRSNQNKLYQFFNRLFEIIIAIFGLISGLIFFPLIIIGNLIANRGQLFYMQDRVGRNSEVFKIIKLRTMIENAEAKGAKWSELADDRITPFGRILRNSRIDEIPQFINVLKGEMALIGPRPERPVFVEELKKIIPFYETRHIIKPGLTGWAQVKMRYGSSVEDSLKKLQYDLFYIKKRSFFLDVNIIIKTISTVLYFRGQ
jgi:exopolysaccharide biosynthesis polyprenyl glycosylphosphotransferase